MYLHSKGIILRTTKYSESSLILDIYTEQKGRKSFIISGIRSKQAKTKAGLLQVMGLVDFVSYDKDTSSLIRIKEINADYLYKLLPFDVLRSCLGIFLIEVCSKSISQAEANPELFEFIRSYLIGLDTLDKNALSTYHIHFLIDLSRNLGFAIQNNYSEEWCYLSLRDGMYSNRDFGSNYSMDEESSKAVHHLLGKEKIRIPKAVRNIILNKLILYYKYHIEDFGNIKSLEVLRTVFS